VLYLWYLSGPPDPSAKRAVCGCLGEKAECRPTFQWPLGARRDARRECCRSSSRPPLYRRPARLRLIPTSAVQWLPCYRIIPSRFPPINLFERVTDPADLETVLDIESMTNDRL